LEEDGGTWVRVKPIRDARQAEHGELTWQIFGELPRDLVSSQPPNPTAQASERKKEYFVEAHVEFAVEHTGSESADVPLDHAGRVDSIVKSDVASFAGRPAKPAKPPEDEESSADQEILPVDDEKENTFSLSLPQEPESATPLPRTQNARPFAAQGKRGVAESKRVLTSDNRVHMYPMGCKEFALRCGCVP
jgi:hypothetical protein